MTYLPDNEESQFEIPDFGAIFGVPDQDGESPDFLPAHVTAHDPAPSVPGCSVTNPAQTVTATAAVDGRLQGFVMDFGPGSAASLTEQDLGHEILLVGRLAGRKARSQLFDFLVEGAGDDVESTRRFLRDEMGLPTPEQAAAEQAEVFGIRLRDNDD